MVHQVGAGVVADAFENGRRDQRKSHDGPGIGEMRRDELLQVHRVMRAGDNEELNVLRPGRGIQNPIEHRADQQILERVESADRSHE